jgi:hypothetical protein
VIHNDGGNGNTLFVASPRSQLQILHPPEFDHIHEACVEQVKAAFTGLRETNPVHGRVLTDDYNPVEVYDAANRERHRRMMAIAMRDL